MKYSRFEELPVWQDAIKLALSVYAFSTDPTFAGRYSLKDQLERAAVSVSNNIAEGFERGTTQELLTFLYIARGSCGEVRSMLCLLERVPGFENFKFEISNLKLCSEGISRQLRTWAEYLQNSDIRGHRYLTDRTRAKSKEAREREEFLKELKEIQNRNPSA